MEKTLIIIKPGAIRRDLIGEIIHRFEMKGLQLCGIKMMQLNDDILDEHYAHLADRPYFQRIKNSMMKTPVVVSCWKGVDVVEIAHHMAGTTNGRSAMPGTIRGDYSVSIQENIIHTSDTVENAKSEIERFFGKDEIFDFNQLNPNVLYAENEC
ncbi:MAG: Nucleoside-diphosphate kinase [Bacteroidetes bacterium]|jgi:nucleoside-diphosphate kinase|nr:Nucleoside-diphosphate kinase [Bacteroidota bacterium]